MKSLRHILSHLVFWVWNLTFIALMYIWVLPEFGFDLLQAARNGEIDPTFTVSFTALLLVPLISTLLGFFRLRKYPILLMRLFYGIEAPLFALCLLRIFLIRELTVASGFLLGLVVVAIATFAIELLSGYSAYRPRLAKVQMVSHSVILLVGLYLGTVLFLYSLPALITIIVSFFQFDWVSGFGYALTDLVRFIVRNPIEVIKDLWFGSISLLFIFLFCFSALVFFSMPYTLVNFYVRAWARIRTAFGKQYGDKQSWAITGTTIALSCLVFIGVQAQPQTKAFNLLDTPAILDTQAITASSESATSASSQSQPAQIEQTLTQYRQSQLDNAPAIQAGLTNAYLYRYRYLSPWSQSNQLKQMYRDALYMKEGGAQFFQTIHNALLSPFLYRGGNDDPEKAAELYAQMFDTSIQQAKRPAIRKALQATANRDETSAGLLNLDQKIVRLASQKVSVTEKGDWGTVEIHEQYENFTNEPQEIFYSFSLPESAAITGLWLGDAESPKHFKFVVSPRGAAQQVYKGEVERGQRRTPVDPALLEQVGPRQYRLRVFPIPAAENLETALGKRVPGELHLWMTYQVMQQDGGWPLPQLSEKRSIFWTEKTQHLRGQRQVDLSEDQWFEAAIPARKKVNAQAHTVALEEGYQVTATPITAQEKQLPTGKRFAIVIDSSYSMGEHVNALKQATERLKLVGKNNTLDFYMTTAAPVTASEIDSADSLQPADNLEKQSSVDINKMMFYGSLQPADMLQQFDVQRGNSSYDAVILLTDEGSYELAKDHTELPDIQAPLWIIHVNGKMPSAYEDSLLQALQTSKGGVETTAIAALQKIALAAQATTSLDGYTWQVTPLDNSAPSSKATHDSSDVFQGIAARQLIFQQSRRLDTSQVAALDEVHEIAKRTGVVTPYSSMLVLVDDRQKELLKEAEASEDRFDREVEDGQDNLTQPGNPITASVPEPGQVFSLLVGATALVLLKRKSGLTHATNSKRKLIKKSSL